MFLDLWALRLAKAEGHAKAYADQARKAQKQIDTLLDRIVEADSPSIISAYEKRIGKLEREKLLAEEKAAQTAQPRYAREELFELAFAFLANPYNIYKKGSLTIKKTVLRLAFSEPISYSRSKGVRTPKIAFPFKDLEEISTTNCCEMTHSLKSVHFVTH